MTILARKSRTRTLMVAMATVLAMAAGSALAAVPSTTAYLNASRPMITGKVISVNEHQVVVATEQEETIALALDTRTLVPVDLASGMMMRVEFKMLDDGRRYAERIIPIRRGMDAHRGLAYSHEREGDAALAGYAAASDGWGAEDDPGRASTALSVTNQPLGTSLAATPSTDPYRVAMEPMIAGQVATVNDHRIVVNTDQGQRVALEMDSRTIVPVSLAANTAVRVDYRAMKNGSMYAERITLIKGSVNTSHELSQMGGLERHEVVAQNAAVDTPANEPESSPQAMSDEVQSPPQATSDQPETLPQTASSQPLLALLGFLALAAAGALALVRRLHTA